MSANSPDCVRAFDRTFWDFPGRVFLNLVVAIRSFALAAFLVLLVLADFVLDRVEPVNAGIRAGHRNAGSFGIDFEEFHVVDDLVRVDGRNVDSVSVVVSVACVEPELGCGNWLSFGEQIQKLDSSGAGRNRRRGDVVGETLRKRLIWTGNGGDTAFEERKVVIFERVASLNAESEAKSCVEEECSDEDCHDDNKREKDENEAESFVVVVGRTHDIFKLHKVFLFLIC